MSSFYVFISPWQILKLGTRMTFDHDITLQGGAESHRGFDVVKNGGAVRTKGFDIDTHLHVQHNLYHRILIRGYRPGKLNFDIEKKGHLFRQGYFDVNTRTHLKGTRDSAVVFDIDQLFQWESSVKLQAGLHGEKGFDVLLNTAPLLSGDADVRMQGAQEQWTMFGKRIAMYRPGYADHGILFKDTFSQHSWDADIKQNFWARQKQDHSVQYRVHIDFTTWAAILLLIDEPIHVPPKLLRAYPTAVFSNRRYEGPIESLKENNWYVEIIQDIQRLYQAQERLQQDLSALRKQSALILPMKQQEVQPQHDDGIE